MTSDDLPTPVVVLITAVGRGTGMLWWEQEMRYGACCLADLLDNKASKQR